MNPKTLQIHQFSTYLLIGLQIQLSKNRNVERNIGQYLKSTIFKCKHVNQKNWNFKAIGQKQNHNELPLNIWQYIQVRMKKTQPKMTFLMFLSKVRSSTWDCSSFLKYSIQTCHAWKQDSSVYRYCSTQNLYIFCHWWLEETKIEWNTPRN